STSTISTGQESGGLTRQIGRRSEVSFGVGSRVGDGLLREISRCSGKWVWLFEPPRISRSLVMLPLVWWSALTLTVPMARTAAAPSPSSVVDELYELSVLESELGWLAETQAQAHKVRALGDTAYADFNMLADQLPAHPLSPDALDTLARISELDGKDFD